MIAIWKREMQAFFYTPIGYIFLGLSLALFGLLFWFSNIAGTAPTSDMSNAIQYMTYLFIITSPVLTMRLFSEDRKNKSDQLLLTSPVSLTAIVLGKFLAAVSVLLIMIVISFVYIIIINIYVTDIPAYGEMFLSYLGFFLVGSSLISIGLLISTMTENQVSAAIVSICANAVLLLLFFIAPNIRVPFLPFLPTVLNWFSIFDRFTSFNIGLFSIADFIYYISFISVFLFLSVRVIEKRRWSEG